MMADRLRPARTKRAGAEPEERKRGRLARYLFLIFGAGVVSGTAALAGIPPFGSLQALLGPLSQTLHPQPAITQIKASTLYPAVPPVHKTVDVYDPAPPVRRASPTPRPPAASPEPKPSPSPPLHSSPSPTPHGGD